MGSGTVFERYEIKYIITEKQKELIKNGMGKYMAPDKYGRSVIRNIYYDTADSRLIRRSNEKPVYKEKLRVRSYKRVESDDEKVFVELKKKYNSVVYKRRTVLSENTAAKWLNDGQLPQEQTQIISEIEYFRRFYGSLVPSAFVSYDREAFFAVDGSDFRITFDENITARTTDLSLKKDVGGEKLLGNGLVLMELKTHSGIPLWMTSLLSENEIYKTSFSKYGTAYRTMIFPEKGEIKNVC